MASILGTSAAKVKAHLPWMVKHDASVANETRSVLATNLQSLMDRSDEFDVADKVAKKASVDQKTVWRMLNSSTNPSLDNIEKVASVFGLLPWQILVPALDGSNPPEIYMTRTEAALFERVKSDMSRLMGDR